MFGDDTNNQATTNDNQATTPVASDTSVPSMPAPQPAEEIVNEATAADATSTSTDSTPVMDEPAAAPTPTSDDLPATITPSDEPADSPAPAVEGDGDLASIKQQALAQLTPIVGQLDQTPEEKFRTTMMMIQASDNQSLIKDAYEAAQGITDEKAKAQALLDIVNEINYFTQSKDA